MDGRAPVCASLPTSLTFLARRPLPVSPLAALSFCFQLDVFGLRLTRIIACVCVAVWLMNYKEFATWENLEGSECLPCAC